jgi:hypothetical protein
MIGFILSLISPNTHDGKCPSLWDSSFIFGGIYQQRKAAELLYQRLIVTLFLFFKHIIILKNLTQGYVKTKTQTPMMKLRLQPIDYASLIMRLIKIELPIKHFTNIPK